MLDLPSPRIMTVTEITRSIRGILETELPFVTVSGEISNLRQPYSGHLYFTLKDDSSQLKAVLFKQHQKYLRNLPGDGQQVICRGRISVYEPRGEYQLIIDYLERSGTGELQIAFENLKRKLAEEGLFDQDIKKEIPPFPGRIAVVTSPGGAALFDFLKVALHRFPAQPLEIFPVRVQGKEAAGDICDAIENLNRLKRSDIIVVCRGGGSIEDLWPFNEEKVARAIFASVIPVVTGIGHEIDFTIADFTADLRTATPSAAAEIVVPSAKNLAEHISRLKGQLNKSLWQLIQEKKQRLRLQQRMLSDPRTVIVHHMLHLDNICSSLVHNFKSKIYDLRMRLESHTGRLHKLSPAQQLSFMQQWSEELSRRLQTEMQQHLDNKRAQLESAVKLLVAVSPLEILARGYAVVRSGPDEVPPGVLIRSSGQVTVGKSLEVILKRGKLACKVTEILENGRDERI